MKKNVKCFVSLLFLSLFFITPAFCADLFVMTDIPIYGEAKTASEAREKALTIGKKQAFVDLLDTIVSKQDRSKVVIEEDTMIESFVSDVSVDNEKASSTTYYGSLTVRFKAPEIRQFLETTNVSFLARLPQPFLILPVYQNERGIQILSENNPMVNIVRNQMPATRLFQFKTLQGDDKDIAAANAGVIEHNNQALKALAGKNFVSQILILKIQKQGIQYTVSTEVWPKGAAPEAEINFTITDDRDSESRVCADLIHDAVRAMSKKWLYLAQNSTHPITVYQVYAPIEKISDLSKMKQKLTKLNFADKVDIKGFSNKKLAVDFHYRGGVGELGEKLRLNNLILTAVADENGQMMYLLTEPNKELAEPTEADIQTIQ